MLELSAPLIHPNNTAPLIHANNTAVLIRANNTAPLIRANNTAPLTGTDTDMGTDMGTGVGTIMNAPMFSGATIGPTERIIIHTPTQVPGLTAEILSAPCRGYFCRC